MDLSQKMVACLYPVWVQGGAAGVLSIVLERATLASVCFHFNSQFDGFWFSCCASWVIVVLSDRHEVITNGLWRTHTALFLSVFVSVGD